MDTWQLVTCWSLVKTDDKRDIPKNDAIHTASRAYSQIEHYNAYNRPYS